MSVAMAVLGVVALLFGGFFVYKGYRRWQVARWVSATPTTKIGDLREPGLVEIKGEVVDAKTMEAPLSQESGTVVAGWEVQEWKEKHNSADGWRTMCVGIDATPFVVNDGTGIVAVDPEQESIGEGDILVDTTNLQNSGNLSLNFLGFHIGLGRFIPSFNHGISVGNIVAEFESLDVAHEVGVTESAPDHIEDFDVMTPGLTPQMDTASPMDFGKKHGRRRYFEETVGANDSVYVLGEARPRPGVDDPSGPRDFVIVPPKDDDSRFIVSTLEESTLAWRSRFGLLVLLFGCVVGALGLFLLVTAVVP